MQKASVLIVDDTPDHISYAGSILKNDGYKVYAVTSGKDALDFLNLRQPDIIMLDIKMEGMNGLEVCRKIKSNENTKNIPVIFITSENNPNIVKQGFTLGCCDYVVKPFTKEEYLARVQTHIEISRKNKELVEANNELKLFCSAVSHDLKSPLNAISMLIDMLRTELGSNSDIEIFKITEMINEKSVKLTVMIDRLLEFSRMFNVIPEIETIDLESVFSNSYTELKFLEPSRNIILQCDKIPPVNGDEVMIEMLVKNLMTNAFKFTSGRKKALIKVEYKSDENYHIISVTDNGAGFDMAYSDKLFKIFQRLHDSDEFEGTGVGLALCQRIMIRHGGKIDAVGKINQGAEFKLYFPK